MNDQLAIQVTNAANAMRRLEPEAVLAERDRVMQMVRSTDPLTQLIGRFAVIGMEVTARAVEAYEDATK